MHAYFAKLRQNLELTNTFDALVQARHASIRSAVTAQDSKLIGSLQRRTKIQPIVLADSFDIDILIVLGEFNGWVSAGGITASTALNDLYNRVLQSDRYTKKDPRQDAPAITLSFADNFQVELIPAYVDRVGHNPAGFSHSPTGRAYWIPKNGYWELADYDFDAQYISERNEASKGYLIPTIKMLKAIKRLHFREFNSFALEILAARVIPTAIATLERASSPITYPGLLRLFFNAAKEMLANPLQIPGSLSSAIAFDAFNALAFASRFDALATRLDQILACPDHEQIEGWRQLFGSPFPKTI